MLAIELAAQAKSYGADVVGIYASLVDLQAALDTPSFTADIALLDVQLMDGEIYGAVPRLEALGIAIIFSSGYPPTHRPDEHSHHPWLTKPFGTADFLRALRRAIGGRGDRQSG